MAVAQALRGDSQLLTVPRAPVTTGEECGQRHVDRAFATDLDQQAHALQLLREIGTTTPLAQLNFDGRHDTFCCDLEDPRGIGRDALARLWPGRLLEFGRAGQDLGRSQ